MTKEELHKARVEQAACPSQVAPVRVRAKALLLSSRFRHSSLVIQHSRRRRAFSMAELMIAVVILGIGLLITSSMFPIAWFKAREVAESAVVPALADAAEVAMELNCRGSQGPLDQAFPRCRSSLFPGDWIPLAIPTAANSLTTPNSQAFIYPDTRVHHLNTGNYLAEGDREDYRTVNGDVVPVGDDSWRLEDNIKKMLADRNPLDSGFNDSFIDVMLTALEPHYRAHGRLALPLDALPLVANNPEQIERDYWEERFELRRHCWAVFYRFSKLSGLELAVESSDLNGDGDVNDADDCIRKFNLANLSLKQSRQLTAYYVTLKRPVNARYARQQGYDPNNPSSEVIDPADPRAMDADEDYRLPSPWRFSARLLTLPVDSVPGVQSEIVVPTSSDVLYNVLDDGVVLIDDRTGQVFTITSRREGLVNGVDSIVLTLDGFYRVIGGQFAPDYDPNDSGTRAAWEREMKWVQAGCDQAVARVIADGGNIPNDIIPSECRSKTNALGNWGEDDPGLRTYWFFPPPVERSPDAPANTPLFDGSPPVVGVEVRQLTL